jgi:hypothetical protein
MLRRITRLVPGLQGAEPTMTVGPPGPGTSSNEPCEDCGATPADVLVDVRYLCPDCARIERARIRVETEIAPS